MTRSVCVCVCALMFPRGYLQLTLLPTSDMRLSFCGDNGVKESLAVVGHLAGNSEVTIEEISADGTGRTFVLRLSENHLAYFWCSEKSQLLGSELLSKVCFPPRLVCIANPWFLLLLRSADPEA